MKADDRRFRFQQQFLHRFVDNEAFENLCDRRRRFGVIAREDRLQTCKPIALAHRDAFYVIRESDLNWTYFSPAMMIQPGERTGKFRLGKDALVSDAQGNSAISAEDYAIALVDEVEQGRHTKQRFTIGY